MYRWMGPHFHDWIDYNRVAHLRDFWVENIFVSRNWVASHACVFRGARISSVGRDEVRDSLKTRSWNARNWGKIEFARHLRCMHAIHLVQVSQ